MLPGTDNFGDLLRSYRARAGLSQEELAEKADLSLPAIGALERGFRRAPYQSTVLLLAKALDLTNEESTALEAARRSGRSQQSRGRVRSVSRDSNAGEPRNNLAMQLTAFIGREDELAELSSLLADHRLITVTGSGGVGKTRAALEIAARVLVSQRDEVWFVDLSPLADGAQIPGKITSVVGISFTDQGDQFLALARSLKQRKLLLVLDNCEHLIADAAIAARTILQTCPQIAILATSRERLGIAGELVYRLPSLPPPSAAELFVDRVTLAEPHFFSASHHVETVADICRRLDGIPLAIELAAARAPSLGLVELRTRLNETLALASAHRDLPQRQQTILATIAWSYDLLSERERVLMRRVAVFVGGFTLEAAEGICADALLETVAIPDLLSSLVEKSLVDVVIDDESARYILLESMRAFGLEQLAVAGELAPLRRQHAAWFAAFADRADASYFDTPRILWLTECLPEFDNARAAIDWALISQIEDDALIAGHIAGGLRGMFFSRPANYGECLRYTKAALERIDEARYPRVVGRLLQTLTQLANKDERAIAFERVAALYERIGDMRSLAMSNNRQAVFFTERGDFGKAEQVLATAVAILADASMRGSASDVDAHTSRAFVRIMQGRLDEARVDLNEMAALGESTRDAYVLFHSARLLGIVEFAEGNTERAAQLAEEALERSRAATVELGYAAGLVLNDLAWYRHVLGDLDGAESAGKDLLKRLQSRQHRDDAAYARATEILAATAAVRGKPHAAARLGGFVDAWYWSKGYFRGGPIDQRVREVLCTSLAEQLGADEVAALRAQGAALSLDDAISEALTT